MLFFSIHRFQQYENSKQTFLIFEDCLNELDQIHKNEAAAKKNADSNIATREPSLTRRQTTKIKLEKATTDVLTEPKMKQTGPHHNPLSYLLISNRQPCSNKVQLWKTPPQKDADPMIGSRMADPLSISSLSTARGILPCTARQMYSIDAACDADVDAAD